jgi:prophage regulatory protein
VVRVIDKPKPAPVSVGAQSLDERLNRDAKGPKPEHQRTTAEIVSETEASLPPQPEGIENYLWPLPRGPPVLWRLPLVLRLTGMKATQIYDAVEKGLFPRPIKLLPGGRANCWVAQEIVAHIEARIKQRDAEIALAD